MFFAILAPNRFKTVAERTKLYFKSLKEIVKLVIEGKSVFIYLHIVRSRLKTYLFDQVPYPVVFFRNNELTMLLHMTAFPVHIPRCCSAWFLRKESVKSCNIQLTGMNNVPT